MNSTESRFPASLWPMIFFNGCTSITFGAFCSIMTEYAIKVVGLSQAEAVVLGTAFFGLLFTVPLLAGWLANFCGYSKAVILGCLTNLVAFLFMVYLGSKTGFYMAAAGVVVAQGFGYLAYLVLLGRLFARDDGRRVSAYTLSYMSMNLGIFLGGAFCASIAQSVGYSTTFILMAVMNGVALVVFLAVLTQYHTHQDYQAGPQSTSGSHLIGWFLLLLAIVISVPSAAWLLSHGQLTNYLMVAVVSTAAIGLLIYAFTQPDRQVRSHLLVYVVLCVASIGFWALYSLEPSLITLFVDNSVDRRAFGQVIPSSSFYSLEALFIVLLAAPFSMLWVRLARSGRDISLPGKFSLSLWVMGLGFLLLAVAIWSTPANTTINMTWVVFSYLFLSAAELLISPVGNAMVGRLATPKLEGFMMGLWQGFGGMAASVAGLMGGLIVVPSAKESLTASDPIYATSFSRLGFITMGIGLIMLILLPWLNRHLIKPESK